MLQRIELGALVYEMELEAASPSNPSEARKVRWGQHSLEVEVLKLGARGAPSVVRVNGQIRTLTLLPGSEPQSYEVRTNDGSLQARVESEHAHRAAASRGKSHQGRAQVNSPLPGRVVRVTVNADQQVSAGTALLTIEAMKMENEILAPRGGRIARVFVAAGQTVEGGAPLVVIE